MSADPPRGGDRAAAWAAALARVHASRAAHTAALAAIEAWVVAHPLDAAVVDGWAARGEGSALLSAFSRRLPLGTGGRRGQVGVGPNRFNWGTLLPAIAGHAALLRARRPQAVPTVVVAWDVRCFLDLRGELARAGAAGHAHPLRGVTSADFARAAAEAYAAAGVRVWLPPDGLGPEPLSTPELSFAIRALQADGGLNISASHNHPDDNGAKLYGPSGGQEVPPDDDALMAAIAAADGHAVARMPLPEAEQAGWIRRMPSSVIDAYHADLAMILPPVSTPRALRVRFTNLHGASSRTVLPALRAAGFCVGVVDEQAAYDGAFPTVPFRAPNPEVPAALDAAIAVAEAAGDAVVIACDPDADRVGLAARVWPDRAGTAAWRCFSGDELATLLCLAALRLHGSRPRAPVVIQTEVTSSRSAALARASGAQVIDHLLVGFKYIGAEMEMLATGQHPRLPGASLEDVAIGVEESHGVLLRGSKRDKDAADGALALCWLAEAEAAAGRSLLQTLDAVEDRLGPTVNLLRNITLQSADGRERLASLAAGYRAAPPQQLGGRLVLRMDDRLDPAGPLGPWRGAGDVAARDVLVFHLDGGARLVLRPSGTEPKSKLYVELRGDPAEGAAGRPALQAAAAALTTAVLAAMMARIGLHPPLWALACSDLLPVDTAAALAAAIEAARRGAMPPAAVRAAIAAAGPDTWALLQPGLAQAGLGALAAALDPGAVSGVELP